MTESRAVTYAMVRAPRLSLEEFAMVTGLHPDLIRRLVALGLIDARRDSAGELWFSRSQLAAMARVQRLEAAAMPGWYGIAASFDDVQFDRDDYIPHRFLNP